jgi:phthalate 4,5-cis-dihydrodiol dehydrogenase
MSVRKLRLGVAGLGRAFTLMLPTLEADPRIELVAAADPRAEATARFAAQFAGRAYSTMEQLAGDPDVEVVYLATPHELHAAHAIVAAAAGKHVLVEKPIALTLAECDAMIAASERAGVHLVVGHSHSFDRPYHRAREIIASGSVGRVKMINALYYTDFLYRPRRPEELVTERGGGVLFSQGAHQVDILRLLGGGRVASVRALTGAWDPVRPSEGAYAALLTFENGAFATIAYSGYAHFDGDALCGDISEMGLPKDPARYGAMRRMLRETVSTEHEIALKNARNYGGDAHLAPTPSSEQAEAPWHPHFGLVIVCCERGDLRTLPTGVMVYGDAEAHLDALARPSIPRIEVIDELYAAIVSARPPLHSARWAKATLEVVLALLESARLQRDVPLAYQVGVPE